MSTKSEVFISYRRDGGATVARLLYEIFKNRGIRCFMDAETLGEGNFDQSISKHLEDADNFIFIVSPGVFDRCADPGDWVRREIESALQTGKKIIPVFVNGVTGFPSDLPESMRELATKNAIKLSHEHFDAEFEKLVSWLVTRKTRLIEAFINLHDADSEDVTRILNTYVRLVGDEAYKENRKFLANEIRIYFAKSKNFENRLETLLEDYEPYLLQELCEAIAIDATGSSDKMRKTLTAWAQNKDVPPYDDEALNGLDKLAFALGELYKSHAKREMVKEWAIEFGINLYSARSSTDILFSILDQVDVTEFFNRVPFDEKEIKVLCDFLGLDTKGRKSDLIESLKEYVDDPENVASAE